MPEKMHFFEVLIIKTSNLLKILRIALHTWLEFAFSKKKVIFNLYSEMHWSFFYEKSNVFGIRSNIFFKRILWYNSHSSILLLFDYKCTEKKLNWCFSLFISSRTRGPIVNTSLIEIPYTKNSLHLIFLVVHT